MKKGLLFVLSVMSLAFISCSKTAVVDKVLEVQAKAVNAQCPMDVGQGIVLVNAEALPGKVFRFNYTMDASQEMLSDTTQLKNSAKPTIIESLRSMPDMKKFNELGVTIIYRYKDKSNNYLYQIEVSPEEYK